MNVRQATALLLWPLPIMATALMLSSCMHPVMHSTQASPLQVPAPQIAQSGYGAQADFIQCVPPQCPVRTIKTLGTAPAHTTRASPVPTRVCNPLIDPLRPVRDPSPDAHFNGGLP